jgi:CheY-like chemotaxis protein
MPLRCLIVDDSSCFLDAARTLLEGGGFAVEVASNGEQALGQAESCRPDVILVDVFLGEESGLDLARRLVDGGRRDGPTVILISTHSEADLSALIAASPAAGFLTKEELSTAAIQRIVGTHAG